MQSSMPEKCLSKLLFHSSRPSISVPFYTHVWREHHLTDTWAVEISISDNHMQSQTIGTLAANNQSANKLSQLGKALCII